MGKTDDREAEYSIFLTANLSNSRLLVKWLISIEPFHGQVLSPFRVVKIICNGNNLGKMKENCWESTFLESYL